LEQVSAFSENIEESDVRLVLGTVSQELLDGLIGCVASRDAAGVLGFIERAVEEGASFSQLARDLISYCRDLLLLTVGYEGTSTLSDHEKKTRHHFANELGHARILGTIELLRAAEKETRENTNHRLLLELALVRATSDQFILTSTGAAPVSTPAPAGFTAPRAPQPVVSRPQVQAEPQHAQPQVHAPEAMPSTPPVVPEPAAEPETAPQSEAPIEAETTSRPQPVWRQQAEAGIAESATAEDAESTPAAEEASVDAPATSGSRKKGRRIHTMEEFTELWPFVLMRVRKKIGITAVAYLHDALPYQLTSSDAILEFQKEFHFEKACEAAKEHPFEQVLNECFDVPRRLKFRLAERKPEPVKKEEAAPQNQDDDDEEEQDIFAVAQQLFAGEVVSRSGGG
jgi:DNA polymerase-3 subunit gamma/tau